MVTLVPPRRRAHVGEHVAGAGGGHRRRGPAPDARLAARRHRSAGAGRGDRCWSCSRPAGARVGSAVFATCALVLFTVSATMHRGGWSPRVELVLTRMDHASIFLLIAGSYTPFSLLLLAASDRVVLLSVAWGAPRSASRSGCSCPARRAGSTRRSTSRWAGRRCSSPATSRSTASPPWSCCSSLGGLLYTVGGVVYGLRRPNPVPQWFGFHEVFHTFTRGVRRALRRRLDRDLLAALRRPSDDSADSRS